MKLANEQQYRLALAAAEKVMSAKAGTPEGLLLDAVTALIEEYEAEHYVPKLVEQHDPRESD